MDRPLLKSFEARSLCEPTLLMNPQRQEIIDDDRIYMYFPLFVIDQNPRFCSFLLLLLLAAFSHCWKKDIS